MANQHEFGLISLMWFANYKHDKLGAGCNHLRRSQMYDIVSSMNWIIYAVNVTEHNINKCDC